MAEDFEDDEAIGTKMKGRCMDFDEGQVDKLKEEFSDVFTNKPGKTSVCRLVIQTREAPPIASMPYRMPDKLKEGVRQEIDKLIELGVVVSSLALGLAQ